MEIKRMSQFKKIKNIFNIAFNKMTLYLEQLLNTILGRSYYKSPGEIKLINSICSDVSLTPGMHINLPNTAEVKAEINSEV